MGSDACACVEIGGVIAEVIDLGVRMSGDEVVVGEDVEVGGRISLYADGGC